MSEFKLTGFGEIQNMFKDMIIDDVDERRAMRKGLKIVEEKLENDTPVDSGEIKDSLTLQIKKVDANMRGKVYFKDWRALFPEVNTGFATKSIEDTKQEMLETFKKELIKLK